MASLKMVNDPLRKRLAGYDGRPCRHHYPRNHESVGHYAVERVLP